MNNALARVAGLILAAQLVCLPAAIAATSDKHSVEARLQALQAESEIRRALDDYMGLLGNRDWDNYVLMFAKDGELVMPEGTRKGRDSIRERMAGATARMAAAASAQGRPQRRRAEILSNIYVKVDGETATARSRFTFLGEGEDGKFSVTGSGLYLDIWSREDGGWKIKRRTIDWDLLAGAPQPASAAPASAAAPPKPAN